MCHNAKGGGGGRGVREHHNDTNLKIWKCPQTSNTHVTASSYLKSICYRPPKNILFSVNYSVSTITYAQFCTNYRELPRALDEFKPDMVVYNAGTDVLKGDPLGILDITPEVMSFILFSFGVVLVGPQLFNVACRKVRRGLVSNVTWSITMYDILFVLIRSANCISVVVYAIKMPISEIPCNCNDLSMAINSYHSL